MPELPDIAAYLSALEPRIVGQRLHQVRVASAFLLRTVQPPLSSAEGRTVSELRRVGKRIAIGMEGDLWLVLHLMIAGRLHWRPAGAKLAGRNSLAAFDFANGSLVLTEAGTKRRASLHVLSGEQGLQSIDPGGIEVFEPDRFTSGLELAVQASVPPVWVPVADAAHAEGEDHLDLLRESLGAVRPHRAGGEVALGRGAPYVVHHQLVAGLLQVRRHAGTHRAEPDETDFHCISSDEFSLSPLAGRGPG